MIFGRQFIAHGRANIVRRCLRMIIGLNGRDTHIRNSQRCGSKHPEILIDTGVFFASSAHFYRPSCFPQLAKKEKNGCALMLTHVPCANSVGAPILKYVLI
jgi:hypothetical protein